MYFCNNCEALFLRPTSFKDKYGTEGALAETTYTCPACNSTDFVEAKECAVCGGYITDDYIHLATGEDICPDCYTTENINERI